jgi:hypothetical protein
MNRKRIISIMGFSFILLFISFTFGYQFMKSQLKQIDNINNPSNVVEQNDPLGVEIVREDNRISPNTFIEERIHYKACDHLISGTHPSEVEIINMTKGEYEEHLRTNSSNLRLISFSNTKIVLWSERNHLCKNHYILGEENGKIAIFTIGDDGQRILDNVFTEYPITLLKGADQDRIIEGIIVDSKDELSDLLENYIS